MDNISSDMNFSEDKDKNYRYDEESESLHSKNKTLKPIEEEQVNDTTIQADEISGDIVENVAEKVEGLPFLKLTWIIMQ
jgi:hypothetical protein